MANPVETPLPDGWVERPMSGGVVSFKNPLTSRTTSTRPAYPASYYAVTPRPRESDPGDTNAPELIEYPDGSLGYVSDGIFIMMYGPPKKVKDVGHMTITKEENRGTRIKTVIMDNLLFSCEDRLEDPDGTIFIQQPWPTDDIIIVRAVYPEALRGEGAMIRSNLSRVYVVDATVPHHARKGYLAVEGLEMVETFLGDFSLKSRFGGYKDSKTDEGNRAPSFVVEDTRTYVKPKGYYITARPSSEDPIRIICHLKERAYGPIGNFLRALFPPKGPNLLREWVMANFPDAKTLLFD